MVDWWIGKVKGKEGVCKLRVCLLDVWATRWMFDGIHV